MKSNFESMNRLAAVMVLPALTFVLFLGLTLFSARVGNTTFDASQSDNQLPWQSALWALIALALGTMTDLPSKLGDFSEDLTFYLKASPFICFLNSLQSVSVFVYYMRWGTLGTGIWSAFDDLAHEKFGHKQLSRGLRRPVRYTIFVLGSLPQAVKLYSFKGALVAQIIGTCYLVDFFVDEIIFQVSLYRRSRQKRWHGSSIFQQSNQPAFRDLSLTRRTTFQNRHRYVLHESKVVGAMALTFLWSASIPFWSLARSRSWSDASDRLDKQQVLLCALVAAITCIYVAAASAVVRNGESLKGALSYLSFGGVITSIGTLPAAFLMRVDLPWIVRYLVNRFALITILLCAIIPIFIYF